MRRIERVGIIGAGAAATLHLQALRRIPGVRVVAIRDLDAQKAASLAARFGLAKSVADPAGFYTVRPQSVHITASPAAHEALAAEALRHGAHVLVEKPPALTPSGCAALVRQAEASMLEIGVNESTASHPLIQRARAAIEDGRLGRLLHIDGFYSFGLAVGSRPPGWMQELPGGMLEDLLPHLLTTARALAGLPLVPQYWHLAGSDIEGEAHSELRLFVTAGPKVTGALSLSLAAQPPTFRLVARGTAATLTIDLRNLLFQLSPGGSAGGAIAIGTNLVRSSLSTLFQTAANAVALACHQRQLHGSFFPLIQRHYAALANGTALPAPLKRAVATVEIARAIWPKNTNARESNGQAPPLDAI